VLVPGGTVDRMETLVAPDGTVRSFRPRLAAHYKAHGWKPVKAKSTAKKPPADSVDDNQATDTTEN